MGKQRVGPNGERTPRGALIQVNRQLSALSLRICTVCHVLQHFDAYPRRGDPGPDVAPRCLECKRAADKRHYDENVATMRSRKAAYYRRNSARLLVEGRKRWQRNSKELNSKRIAERRVRRLTDPQFRLSERIAEQMRRVLKGEKRGRPTESMLDYTFDELRAHLERQFLRGMTWENMRDWHIDHIVPLASFSFDGPDHPEFKRAWALTNLRPLWARENVAKGHKRITLL